MQNSLTKTIFLKKSLLSVLAGISLDSYTHRVNIESSSIAIEKKNINEAWKEDAEIFFRCKCVKKHVNEK